MRDALIEQIYNKMCSNDDVFFVSADMGAPALDKIRHEFKNRFINVGIAEQNLINVSCGLALEGITVFSLAIAPFLSMRVFEQIRVNLAMLAKHRKLNVNLLSVGVGVSYDVSGPSHHCLEDISIIRTLPNITLLSPSDWISAANIVDYSIKNPCPKYIRLEGKPLESIDEIEHEKVMKDGFGNLRFGSDICIVSTGYTTHLALKISDIMLQRGKSIGVIDIQRLKPIDQRKLLKSLMKYKTIFTFEEAFIEKAGLDSIVQNILNKANTNIKIKSFGFRDEYDFGYANRDYLYNINKCSQEHIIKALGTV